jgi:hypothetical protein
MCAPVSALWVQRKIEEDKAIKDRRQAIFKALWVNRRRQFWIARVDALNMIDVEFIGEEKVLAAWRALFAHYGKEHQGLTDNQISNEREELFATLVFEMGQVLKYGFDRTYVRDNIYRPKLHNDLDVMNLETQQLVNNLLKSDALPVRFVGGAPQPQAQPNAPKDNADATVLLPPAKRRLEP